MTDSGKKLWYVVQTNPREEARALHYLNEKGVETFFPRIKVVRYRGGKVGQVVRPMFPSYIFVRFSVPEEIPYVHWTRGVKRILGAEENPVPISDEVVSFITDQTDDEGVAKIGSPLKPKDKVKVSTGPFKDLIGIFERVIDDKGRVEILLQVIGYHARIQLHESLLERVP